MSKHVRRAWRHYDTAPLVYVDTRFDYPSIYRCNGSESMYPDVLASVWSRPNTSLRIGPARHRAGRKGTR